MTRQKAFLCNTLAYVILAIAFSGLAVWLHPGPLLTLNEAEKPLLLTLVFGAITGPILMLYVFKPGKKTLRLDVTTLVVLQAIVWGTGAWLLWQERPGWLVISQNRIALVRINEIDASAIGNPDLRQPPPGRPHLVIARLPEDPRRQRELITDSHNGGPRLEYRPALYKVPSAEDARNLRARTLGGSFFPDAARERAQDNPTIVLLPMVGRDEVMVVALDLSDWSLADWWSIEGNESSS